MGYQRTIQASKPEATGTAAVLKPEPPVRRAAHPLVRLGQTIGNQSLQHLLHSRLIQPRLAVSEPGDSYEQEAERVSNQVTAADAMPAGGGYMSGGGTHGQIQGKSPLPAITPTRQSPGVVQRQTTGSQSAPAITARTIFPFAPGSRLVLHRILPNNWFDMLSGLAPDMATALQAVDKQIATVTSATDDLFEATLSSAINLPAQGNRPAVNARSITVTLRRQKGGTFDLEMAAQTEAQKGPVALFALPDLTAKEEGGAIILSTGAGSAAVPQLRVAPGATAGQVRIEAFSAPFLDQVPKLLRNGIPERLEALQLTPLKDVQPGTAEEKKAVSEISSDIASHLRQPRQRLTIGGGILSGGQIDPLLSASWQINFKPVRAAGSLFQVPLQLQLQYAPSGSVLGRVSSGAEFSLSQLSVPVNLRIVAGLGGGTILGAAPEGSSDRPRFGAFGPSLEVGAGLELGRLRFDVSYQFLDNLIKDNPNIHSGAIGVGYVF